MLLNDFMRICGIERAAVELALQLSSQSGVKLENFGISGSIMVGLSKGDSDIDIVVYGSRESRMVARALRDMLDSGLLGRLGVEKLRELYIYRGMEGVVGFDVFRRHEERKCFQGYYMGREFFVRFIRDLRENPRYGEYRYRGVGHLRARFEVLDDVEAIFTPARYPVRLIEILSANINAEIGEDSKLEIWSLRGMYCEQARRGEVVEASGKVEEVYRGGKMVGYRLVLGGPGDYMISLEFL
jgi:predicted nucleotidyltransferase